MAKDRLTLADIESRLNEVTFIRTSGFDIFRTISTSLDSPDEADSARSTFLRLLEHRDALANFESIIGSLHAKIGLYPYIRASETTSTVDLLRIELHRPDPFPNDQVVFHRLQSEVYWELMDGKSIILSAPTSFGKSLIIDALLSSLRYNQVVVIVPTLALIDETRRRISRHNLPYKVITHPSQARETRNVFVLTQERALERTDLDHVD